jgi:hypothetical protein
VARLRLALGQPAGPLGWFETAALDGASERFWVRLLALAMVAEVRTALQAAGRFALQCLGFGEAGSVVWRLPPQAQWALVLAAARALQAPLLLPRPAVSEEEQALAEVRASVFHGGGGPRTDR